MDSDVAGERMFRSPADFEWACMRRIDAEVEQRDPETRLVDLLCDAIRLSRDYAVLCGAMRHAWDETQASVPLLRGDLQDAQRYQFLRTCMQGLSLTMDGTQHWYLPSHILRAKTRTVDEAVDAAMAQERPVQPPGGLDANPFFTL